MVEADSHLNLPATSMLEIYNVFEHIYAVQRHTVAALTLNSYTHSTKLRFWGSGYEMMSLRHG
jgi:hypothetical protein